MINDYDNINTKKCLKDQTKRDEITYNYGGKTFYLLEDPRTNDGPWNKDIYWRADATDQGLNYRFVIEWDYIDTGDTDASAQAEWENPRDVRGDTEWDFVFKNFDDVKIIGDDEGTITATLVTENGIEFEVTENFYNQECEPKLLLNNETAKKLAKVEDICAALNNYLILFHSGE